ncbi:hypothetical protein NL676_025422 [Syzygium grande]|nr:hypothetical protein NL676_025422 [Syzygium grande]
MKAAVLCFLPMALALATFTEKDNCVRTCGNVSVPFPFGLDESCAWNSKLVLTCDHTSGNLSLFKNVPLFDIFVENGTMNIGVYRTLDCYNETGGRLAGSKPYAWIRVGEDGHYTFSDTRNKLTVLGCDNLALISDTAGTFGSGCFSYCHEDVDFTAESACSGLGCCQTSIPKSLRSLNISMAPVTNYTSVWNFSSCGSAFVVDQESFDVSDYKLPIPEEMGKYVFSSVVVDWVVERNLTCEEAQSNRPSYACGANSNCSDFENGNGYRCFCQAGYTGNPYASPSSPGCQDIDECKDPQQYPCHGNCKNTPGNYTCNCPFGMTGDGKIGCQTSHLVIIAAGELTTKSDVYSFGVILVELLTGETPTLRAKSKEKINIVQSFISAMENRTLLHMINFEASNEGELREIEVVGSLARRCLNYSGVNRPTMSEVAEQLARIDKNLWGDQWNDEETQSLLDETRCDPLWTSISEMNKPESTDLLVFDIEAATPNSSGF